MKRIHLHGSLKQKFGDYFDFDAVDPAEAVRALIYLVKGFRAALEKGEYCVIRGERDKGYQLEAEQLTMRFGTCRDLHIVPVVAGAKGGGGVVKTIVGVLLITIAIAGAVFTGGASLLGVQAGLAYGALGGWVGAYGTIASIGLAVTLAGVATLLTPNQRMGAGAFDQKEAADQRPSYLFGGPVNRSQQGSPVPLVYGKTRTGSVVVSTGLVTEVI